MSPDSPDQPRSVAVARLEDLGLSAYAARTFVALVRLGGGTAKEVSDVSEVPRTRVYDAVEELQDRGLVDVQHGTPRQFWVVSTETAARQFEREYTRHLTHLTDALEKLETPARTSEQRGVWTVTGREVVTGRLLEFLEAAERGVVFMSVDELLTDEVVEGLEAASERGVSVRLAEMADSVEADLRETVPDADAFESMWGWSDTPAGRVLLVDGEQALVSVLVPGNGDNPPEPRDETAIWGSGETNSLVVVVRAMFTWQLDDDGSTPAA